jgi:streptogramin lyase
VAQVVLESGELGPSAPDALAVAFDQGRLWVSTEREVRELDPRTGETLRSAPIRGISSWLAFGGGRVWAYRWSADREDVVSVLQIDPGTLRVVETIPVSHCSDAREVMYAGQGVWIACKGSGHVLRVSPETGEALIIATGGRPHQLAKGAGSVWVTNLENTVSRIDVSSNDVVATVTDIGAGAAIAFADGAIWSAGVYGLGRIDPTSNRIDAEIPLIPTGGDYYELVPVEGALWLSTVHRQEVWRVELP